MDRNVPVRIVAAWHGHDPAVSASIYDTPRNPSCGLLARRCSVSPARTALHENEKARSVGVHSRFLFVGLTGFETATT
jgi:hypothetical protein